ncbi:30S ribosomal protein S3 [Chloroflexota bacterium]
MGRKVHPMGFRLGVIRDWQAKWYADSHYAEFLREDMKLRDAIQAKCPDAAISLVEIDRQAKDVNLTLHTARPGIVIGRGGQRVDEIRLLLEKLIGKRARINIQEIRQPEMDAYLVARAVAEQIERRVAYRRAMKQTIFRTIQAGAKGIKISCSGRLGNAEIARRQTMHEGRVPLHTLRADIDYGFTEARTTLGRIGVKVWIFKGEILPEPKLLEAEEAPTELAASQIAEEEPTTAEPAEAIAEPAAETATETTAEAKPKRRTARAKAEITAEPAAEAATETAAEAKPKRRTAKAKAEDTTLTEEEK